MMSRVLCGSGTSTRLTSAAQGGASGCTPARLLGLAPLLLLLGTPPP